MPCRFFDLSLGVTFKGGNRHVGTSVITVRVDSGVDLPFFPAIFGRGSATFSLDASHTVPIGQYVESAPEDSE